MGILGKYSGKDGRPGAIFKVARHNCHTAPDGRAASKGMEKRH